jgi:hypothetical protein
MVNRPLWPNRLDLTTNEYPWAIWNWPGEKFLMTRGSDRQNSNRMVNSPKG